jgi:drug/metabolite transporter (DMT)-like permease
MCFSVTFPATRAAEASFSPLVIGVGRSVPAAVLAVIILAARGERILPPRAALPRVLVVAVTVGAGFGGLTAIALRQVDSVHGAVLTGLIPAATAGMAVLRAGERPRPAYWVALLAGLAVVVGFALIQGAGRLRAADLILLAAMAAGGLGYAEGGALARQYGGWRVICWAVIVALPVTAPVTAAAAAASPPRQVTAAAAAGLAYVSVVSMCLGFFAWYAGLARGGVARVGKIQLAQPALTLLWSALLLGERVSAVSAAAAAAVIAATAVGQGTRVARPGEAGGQSAMPARATTAAIRSRTSSSPGTPLRSPYSAARLAPMYRPPITPAQCSSSPGSSDTETGPSISTNEYGGC